MRNLPQGPTAEIAPGVHAPLIGLGTWPMVGEEATDAVARAIGHGYRHIDTAEKYGNEEAVGEGLRRSGAARDDIFLTTKFNKDSHSKDGVRAAFAAAAGRLGVDYLDLFLVHWPNPGQGRFVEACEGLQHLAEEGNIRSWGVSNFTPEHLRRVQVSGLSPALNQIQLDPETGQREQLAFHRRHGISTGAYSPLGRNGAFLDSPAITVPAAELQVTPGQVVLRWHLQHGRIAVPKSADTKRQQQNLDVFGFCLTEPQMAGIDDLDLDLPPRLNPHEYGH